MHASDVTALIRLLQALYPDKFPGLPPAMADRWLERLRHLEPDLVTQAVKRWADRFTFKAPSLDELLEQVELVRDDQQPLKRTGSSTKSYLEVLLDAANAQADNPERSPDDVSFGHLMGLLSLRSVDTWQDDQHRWHAKLTLQERMQQCYDWADSYRGPRPGLAMDLEAAGRTFAKGLDDGSTVPFS